jgi:hypothetical protein
MVFETTPQQGARRHPIPDQSELKAVKKFYFARYSNNIGLAPGEENT